MAAPRPRSLRQRFLVWGLPALAFLLGAAFTVVVVAASRSDIEAERDAIAAGRAVAAVERRLADYDEVLTSVRGLFIASNVVSRDEFERYISGGRYLQRVPGIEGLVYAPSERGAGGREAFPITYRQPPAPELLGLDLGGRPETRARIAEARRTGQGVGNPPTDLATGGVGLGVYEWIPGERALRAGCLDAGRPECEERRIEVDGALLLLVLRTAEAMSDLSGVDGTTFSVVDIGPVGGPEEAPLTVFAPDDASSAVGEPAEVEAFGRRWQLTFHSLGSASVPGIRTWLIALVGGLATLALTAATYLLASSRQRAEDRAARLTTELAATADRLEESNRDLQIFASAASHDLQSPVSNVRQLATILAEDLEAGDYADMAEHVALLDTVGEHAQALIRGLLAFSRVQTAELDEQPVDTASVVAEVRARLADPVADAGATIEVGELPTVHGDPLLIGQAIENLVGNAVKYRDPGRPLVVRIHGEESADTGTVHVADNGVGIEERHQERVWEIHRRLTTREQVDGTGIGLALVRRIAERSGGSVDLASEPGVGSTFSITLPRRPAADGSSHEGPRTSRLRATAD